MTDLLYLIGAIAVTALLLLGSWSLLEAVCRPRRSR